MKIIEELPVAAPKNESTHTDTHKKEGTLVSTPHMPIYKLSMYADIKTITYNIYNIIHA